MMGKVLYLVDGSLLAYRAFYAFIRNPLRTSKGENTSAVFGFTNSLLKILNDYNPEYIAVFFDSPTPTFRHKLFEEYKATRPPAPDELKPQIPKIKAIVKYLGIPVIEVPGIEADDAIGIVAEKAAAANWDVVIVGSDKDFLQLLSPKIKLLDPREFKLYGKEKVEEKWGVPAEYGADFLALVGDDIDNIPGVPGIGPKTAAQLIRKWGSIENIYENLPKVTPEKVRKLLEQHRDRAMLSKKLATLRLEQPLEVRFEELRRGEIQREPLLKMFRELEFTSLMKKIGGVKLRPYPVRDTHEDYVKGVTKLAIVWDDDFYGISKAEGDAIVVTDKQKLGSLVSDPNISKIVPDVKYLHKNYEVAGPVFDTSIASYLLEPDLKDHSVEYLSAAYLAIPIEVPKQPSFSERTALLGLKAEVLYRVERILLEELREKQLDRLYYEIDLPLARVLAHMEKVGVLIDVGYLEAESQRLARELHELERQIYAIAGEVFNIRSPKQLSYILFEKLKLPKGKRRKTGPSTDVEVLEKLAEEHEIARLLLQYREKYKLKSSYIDVLPQIRDAYGRIHAEWNQTVTATGRLSSSNPNLQNIPKREIRKAFIAPKGRVLLAADYSQIELRIMASLSEDPNLMDAFFKGEDIHTKTAKLLFGEENPETRRRAKVVNFGIMYGMGPYGLSQELKCPIQEAHAFIANYFATYPKVKEWIDRTLEFAREHGYVTTILGRRRYFKNLNHPNANLRRFEERAAINAPIQGSAADMIKKAMLDIYRTFEKEGIPADMIIQVHDELVFEVDESVKDEVREIIRKKMETAIPLKVPVKVEIGEGYTWYEAHT